MKWTSWCNAILGIWLIVATWVAGYMTDVAATNSFVVGTVVLIAAIIAANSRDAMRGARWVNLIAGIWLIISPWVLGFSVNSFAIGNDVVTGVLIAICSWIGLGTTNRIAA